MMACWRIDVSSCQLGPIPLVRMIAHKNILGQHAIEAAIAQSQTMLSDCSLSLCCAGSPQIHAQDKCDAGWNFTMTSMHWHLMSSLCA